MNKSIVAAIALAAISSAYAAPQVVADNSDSVQVPGITQHKLTQDEFKNYEIPYRLTDGQMLKFTQDYNLYYTQIRGEPKARIYPRAPGVFMTAAGTRIEFRDEGETVAVTNLERLPMAVTMPATGRVITASR